ncbi:MAG TPA: V-type ATP synthase subunit E family protein [Nitrososphaeraceae archaeon]|jgi:vacuolar-type H+-ATPase subunit E/Vma4|nr:V-type ATP synthase subunit E family protein [Nitrososphaeraceae archaeon]
MSISYIFIKEIKDRKNKKISILDSTLAEKKVKIHKLKQSTLKEIESQYSNEATARSQREASRIVEAARLQAKKILFNAINSNMNSTFEKITKELNDYTRKSDYKNTLKIMLTYAKTKLGENILIHCREEDKVVFRKMNNNLSLGSSIKTIGGIFVEDINRTRELDLTFEELLRTHEDDLKNFLLERMVKE